MYRCHSNGVITKADTLKDFFSYKGQHFRVLQIIDHFAIIRMSYYLSDIKDSAGKKYSPTSDFFIYNFTGRRGEFDSLTVEQVNSWEFGIYQAFFKVDIATLERFAIKEQTISTALAVGVLNFPFKFRPQNNGDFSGAFNFGAGLGITLKHKSWRQCTHSIITGYSISTIILDSTSVRRNPSKLASINNFSAFSFSVGYLIQYERVQAGIFVGFDRLPKINQQQFGWYYQNKPWVSVAFGIAIFSVEKEKIEKSTKER